MALKMTLKLDNGLMIPDAYIKIEQIAINKETATALIGAFVDNANKIPVYEKIYIFTPDFSDSSQNIYAQGYNYLKQHQDFKESVDV
ncbi:hypothetical protein SAMN02910401_00328 [Megasphaera elsdenii]|uniref:hypothetical protein n=1 Tax=Megasphaera elsdenii TaxID=907 RepID=UPI0008F42EA0|nr:hypothetical protein [Megasphaera elsdenii]SFH78531.1 hypothetical protein SAMN02910401_00328 [Megasphaera elsdenii]